MGYLLVKSVVMAVWTKYSVCEKFYLELMEENGMIPDLLRIHSGCGSHDPYVISTSIIFDDLAQKGANLLAI